MVTSRAGGPGGPAGGGHGGGGGVPPLRGAAGEHGHLVRGQEDIEHQVDKKYFYNFYKIFFTQVQQYFSPELSEAG